MQHLPRNVEDILDGLNTNILGQCQRYLGKEENFVEKYRTPDIDKESSTTRFIHYGRLSTFLQGLR